MSTQQRDHLSEYIADLLLDARVGRLPHGPPLLADLLAAAAAPGRPVEWSSEQACLVAFRAAQLAAVPRSGQLSIVRTIMLRMLTVKAVLAALAAAGGGLVLAGSTGIVNNPFDGLRFPGTSDRPAVDSPVPQAPGRQPSSEPWPSRSVTGDRSGQPSRSPSLLALCHAYQAGNKAEHGKALESPAFGELITAAGGPDRVEAFCAAQLATPATAGPTADSGPPGRSYPTGPPRNPARDHRTGKPTAPPGR